MPSKRATERRPGRPNRPDRRPDPEQKDNPTLLRPGEIEYFLKLYKTKNSGSVEFTRPQVSLAAGQATEAIFASGKTIAQERRTFEGEATTEARHQLAKKIRQIWERPEQAKVANQRNQITQIIAIINLISAMTPEQLFDILTPLDGSTLDPETHAQLIALRRPVPTATTH